MSTFDSLMLAAGALVFWLGLIGLTISLFVVSSRADDIAEEWGVECCGQCGPRGCGDIEPFEED